MKGISPSTSKFLGSKRQRMFRLCFPQPSKSSKIRMFSRWIFEGNQVYFTQEFGDPALVAVHSRIIAVVVAGVPMVHRTVQWHPQSPLEAFPRIPSKPSLAMIGTITSPATESAHHQPSMAFSSNPPRRIAERYVQKSV